MATGYFNKVLRQVKIKIFGHALNKHDYGKVMKNYFTDEDTLDYVIPTIMPRRDRTPRSGKNSLIYDNSTPQKFQEAVKVALSKIENKSDDHKILFLDSWNEWGEGSYMEPDLKFKHGYLKALKKEIFEDE